MTVREPEWYPDPFCRHEYRYFNGARWTDDVADNSVQSLDPANPPPPPVLAKPQPPAVPHPASAPQMQSTSQDEQTHLSESSAVPTPSRHTAAQRSYQALLDAFRHSWPDLPADFLARTRAQWAPLIAVLARGSRDRVDESDFVSNMTGLRMMVDYPGDSGATAAHFFAMLVAGIGAPLEVLREEFMRSALPVTAAQRELMFASITIAAGKSR